MKKRLLPFLLLGVFAGGAIFGFSFREKSHPSGESSESVAAPAPLAPLKISDRIRIGQSGAHRENASVHEALVNPQARTALEKDLRQVPFSVLKEVYLERQDAEWLRQQERYPTPKGLEEAELDARAADLVSAFHRTSGDSRFFTARGTWQLRGKTSVPYIAFTEFYSTRPDPEVDGGPMSGVKLGDANSATNGRELCYVNTVYFRIGEELSSANYSTCVAWVSLRNRHPFAVLSNSYSKKLVPYFDSLSIPLPGFGTENDAQSEWYDSTRNRWTAIGPIRWDPIGKEEFKAASLEALAESAVE